MQTHLGALNIEDKVASLARALANGGLWSGLRYINSTTDYRFTGLYRFDRQTLRTIALFDRATPEVHSAPDVDASLSYCSLMRESGEPLRIADAPNDARAVGHPSRDVVQAYCGIPLIDEDGTVIGSLCHFALEPTLLYDEDLELLLRVPATLRDASVTY